VAAPIALFRPVVAEEAIAAASSVLRSGWPGPGQVVDAFEQAFATVVGARHAVAVTSGTAALHLSLLLLDPERGDEVVCSPITFVGATQAIVHAGCRPVFADVDPATGLLEPSAVDAAITPRTVAIVVTHLGGRPADLEALHAIAERHDLPLIEDAAHACGSSRRGRPIGSHDSMQAFSFQATKNLTTIDGGMLCVNSASDAARARRLRWMGIDRSTWERDHAPGYCWSYEVVEVGHKYAMNDLNAAIGLGQLPHLEAGNRRRREIAGRYEAALADCDGIEVVPTDAGDVSATYLAAIATDRRDRTMDDLAAEGIATGVHYRRNDHHVVFGPARGLPGAERYWTRTLSLPCHLALSDADVDRVIEAVVRSARGVSSGR
jgi:perosamine synthetase